MGIRERRKRDEGAMRRRILDAAMALFSKGGVDKVTMRSIAARIEYSPGAIYRYFSNKDEILLALCHQGFEMLQAHFPEQAPDTDPYERLMESARAYVEFAQTYPAHYELMFSTEEIVKPEKPDMDGVPMQAFFSLVSVVSECMDKGYFQGDSPMSLAISIWSSLHGFSSLLVKRQFEFFPKEDIDRVIEKAFEFIFRMRTTCSAETDEPGKGIS